MLIKSFQADSPERQKLLTNVWNASAVASELTLKLARAVGRPEPGRLVTLVVLSFLGRLATTATMPRGLLGSIAVGSLLERTRHEQSALGLSSSEIGGLLMRDWDLPAGLIDEVRRVDPTLTDADQNLDLALCYLGARLGERLASGELGSLADFDLARDDSLDFHCLQVRLADSAWQALAAALHDPALCQTMQVMTRALRSGASAAAASAVPA
jgi:HD-like signal output (HDOD) protein